jgi:hypothetical protein
MSREKKEAILKVALICFFANLLTLPTPSFAAAGSYTFSNAGATGNTGPSQTQVNNSYSGTSLGGQVTVIGGIQYWTVPATDTYTVEAAGAQGGSVPGGAQGGSGRMIRVALQLTQGSVLKILVGQAGGLDSVTVAWAGSGGGGTFIYESGTSTLLMAVGGGGGAYQTNAARGSLNVAGGNASAYNVTSGSAGTQGVVGTAGGGGQGSSSCWGGSGGAGYSGNGTASWAGGAGIAYSFLNGGVGATSGDAGGVASPRQPGGFGGGGGAAVYTNYEADGGGGGGYSGGSVGGCGSGQGGGGGNFYLGTYLANGLNIGHGYATFTRQNLPAASVSISGVGTVAYRSATNLSVTSNTSGTVSVIANGKTIAGCKNAKLQGSIAPYTFTCSWKPALHGAYSIYAAVKSTGSYGDGSSSSITVVTSSRNTLR